MNISYEPKDFFFFLAKLCLNALSTIKIVPVNWRMKEKYKN